MGTDENYLWVISHSGVLDVDSATVWIRYTKTEDLALIDAETEDDTLIIQTGLKVYADGDAIFMGGAEDAD